MKRKDFNQDWIYYKEGEECRVTVTLPHDAMMHDKRDVKSTGGHANAFFVGGIYVYEKNFFVPAEWQNKHIEFEFGGVYQNSTVYLNEKKAGERPYGYVPFTITADEYLNYGEENIIKVVADNSKAPNSRWYSGGGIYRPVALIIGEKEHIAWQGLKISTLSYAPPIIEVNTNVQAKDDYKLLVEVLNQGKVVATGEGENVVLELPQARLWAEDTPFLYQCRVTLKKGRRTIDVAVENFGIRKLEWSKNGFFVNGKNTLFRGACIHHDNGVLGACTYPEAEERRIQILKENGYNAIRMSHHPAGRYLLDACDKYGMYVMDETFDMWYYHKNKYDYATYFNEWYLKDTEAMVQQDYNHPSVVMYSIGNEVSEPYKPEGVEKAKEMMDYIRTLDAGRAVTAGMNLMIMYMASKGKGIYREEGGRAGEEKNKKKKQKEQASGSLFFNIMTSMIGTGMNKQANSDAADKVTSPVLDTLDIAGYNYASGRYPLEGKKHPNRIIVGTETFPQDIAKNWKMVKEYPYLLGDFMWTGWDYIGEAAIGAWNYEGVTMQNVPYPWLLADVGTIDITGYPGAQAKYASTVWGLEKKPYIGVRPVNHPGKRVSKAVWRGTNAFDSWSWKNCEGNKAEVEVYADADYVELYLNNKKIGKKKIREYKTIFKTRYQPGTLMAISYNKNGKEIARNELKSAQGATKLSVKPEKTQISPGEIVFVPISITGENDIVECNEDCTLKVTVENGELLGFGSAKPYTEERFYDGVYTTYYGRALAVVRSTKTGNITVKAFCDNLEGKAVIKEMRI